MAGIVATAFFLANYMLDTLGALAPFSRKMQYFMNEHWANAIPTTSDLITEYFRGKLEWDDFITKMKKYGFSEEETRKLLEISRPLVNATEATILKWRQAYDPKDAEHNEMLWYQEMSKLGFDNETARKLEKAMLFYPSPTDFIEFAVREVFKEDAVTKYKLDAEFPDDILPHARKAGLTKDVLKWYWRAHWRLPGIDNALRMVNILQPAVLETKLPDGSFYGEKYKPFGINWEDIETTYDDLSEYLKMVDISPFWRDRIKALTFPPITRVDLRRIYALGLITDDELRARLLELGYSLADAEKLMEFYKTYKNSTARDLTRTQIENAYKEGEITRDKAKEYLISLGYDEDEAELILALDDNDIEDEREKQAIDTLKYQFRTGVIDLQKVHAELDKLNIPPKKKENLIAMFMYEKKKKIALPSKVDLLEWLGNGIIDGKTFTEKMEQIGYSKEDIIRYIENVMKTKGIRVLPYEEGKT